HRPARVGARGEGAVAPEHPQRASRVLTRDRGTGEKAQRGEPRGDEIQYVVEARGELAEPLERAVAIAEHRVRGVDGAVRGGTRRAASAATAAPAPAATPMTVSVTSAPPTKRGGGPPWHSLRRPIPIARPIQATGCRRFGGSPSVRSRAAATMRERSGMGPAI